MRTIGVPAPISAIKFSRADLGQGLGNLEIPDFDARARACKVVGETGSPACAAIAAARKPITGSLSKSIPSSIKTS